MRQAGSMTQPSESRELDSSPPTGSHMTGLVRRIQLTPSTSLSNPSNHPPSDNAGGRRGRKRRLGGGRGHAGKRGCRAWGGEVITWGKKKPIIMGEIEG